MQHKPNATDAPAVLKISEVISVMRISRTAAYEGARNFLRTDGADGIPCVRVGRSIRFPRLLLEQYLKQPITADQLSHPYDPTDTDPRLSFLVGWIAGLTIVGLIVLALGLQSSEGEESTASGWVKIVIGVLFFGLAWKQWSSRPRGDEEPTMPGWMSAIDGFTAIKAGGLGAALSALNPKNLGLTIAAMATVGSAGLSTGEEIGTLAVFVVIASVTVALPVVLNLVMGSKATATLNSMKDWLTANNNTVMMVLFVVLGAKLLGAGIAVVA